METLNKTVAFYLTAIVLLIALFPDYGMADDKQFKIIVISSNYSMAYATRTTITDSLVQVQFLGGLVGEKPKLLWSKPLKNAQAKTLYTFLEHKPLDTLKSWYDAGVPDGMRFLFKIDYRGQTKKIQLGNMWVPQLYKLAQIVNTLLPDSLNYDLRLPEWLNTKK